MAVGRCHLFAPSVLAVELYGAWADIVYVRRVFRVEHIILEKDFAMVISWIQEALKSSTMHSFLRNIAFLSQGCSIFIVRHVYRETNLAVDWVASFIAHHSDEALWTSLGMPQSHCGTLFFLTVLAIFILEPYVECTHLPKKKHRLPSGWLTNQNVKRFLIFKNISKTT